MCSLKGRPPVSVDRREQFWRARHDGLVVADAAAVAGVSGDTGATWVTQRGGIRPRPPVPRSPRVLSVEEREELSRGLAEGLSMTEIARRLRRSPCTVTREVERNSDARGRYRAVAADRRAVLRTRRPKPAKLARHGERRRAVEQRLALCWSPEQIARSLRRDFPDRPEMQVSPETIYQSLYVQSRGALRRELAVCLRTGRALRRPKRRADERRGRIPGMVMISQRPAAASDRAVPGHWEGDLIIGEDTASAIGTLVERTTRFTLLVHLPAGHGAVPVRDALLTTIATLPEQLRRSLTWDQGSELARHAEISLASGLAIYFCDPHSPWQRGTNENTNGLLRQYFPKSTDLSVHSAADLAAVAAELNDRPRKTLGWRSPSTALNELLVATAA